MKIRSLDVGLEGITRWTEADEVHLPPKAAPARAFLPEVRPLDDILRRPSLDERLPGMLQPDRVPDELLVGNAISAARVAAFEAFSALAARGEAEAQVFHAAAAVLDAERALDVDIQAALAALLRA